MTITLRHRFRKGEPHPDRDLLRLERRRPARVRAGVYLEAITCPACELLYLATERGQGCTHCDQVPDPDSEQFKVNNMTVISQKATYQIQEKEPDGQWTAASHEKDSINAAKAVLQSIPYKSPDTEFRIVKKTLIIEVMAYYRGSE